MPCVAWAIWWRWQAHNNIFYCVRHRISCDHSHHSHLTQKHNINLKTMPPNIFFLSITYSCFSFFIRFTSHMNSSPCDCLRNVYAVCVEQFEAVSDNVSVFQSRSKIIQENTFHSCMVFHFHLFWLSAREFLWFHLIFYFIFCHHRYRCRRHIFISFYSIESARSQCWWSGGGDTF